MSTDVQRRIRTLEQFYAGKAQAQASVALRDDAEWQRCQNDIAYWIDQYVYTFDPRPEANPHHLRFTLYPFQRDYVAWLEERYRAGQDGLVEKSRDMGATWCVLAWLVHHWLFDDTFQALLGSRKEDLVDNGQIDSLFGRLAYIIEHLPTWMLPAGWDVRKARNYMKIANPENGNALIGESANPNFARQGRYSVVVLDEFAFCDNGEAIWTATADAAKVRFAISTPNGGNHFKKLRYSGRILVYTLHWRLHPQKTEAWYQAECKRRTAEEVAQELDINYERSVRGRVYPEWDLIQRGKFPFTPGWPLYISWDFGLDDATALVWWQRNAQTGLWRIIDAYSNAGKTIDFYVPFVVGRYLSGLPYGYSEADLAKITMHAAWGVATHYGDPAGKQRNQVTGTSVVDELAKHGIYVQSKPDVNTFEARWQATKLFLRRIEGVNEATCLPLHDAMVNARFPERRETSQATKEISKPIHDWSSHYRTAVEYFAVNAPEVENMPMSIVAGRISVGSGRRR